MNAYIWESIITTWWFWISLLVIPVVAIAAYLEFEDIVSAIFGIVMGGFVSALVWFAGGGIINLVVPHYDETSRHDLVVLKDSTSPVGRFVLGSGTLDGKPAFSFYTAEDGYNQLVVLRGPSTRVYQDLKPGDTPWAVTFDNCKLWGKLATCFAGGAAVNEIHVPPGTIKPTLELDAR